MGCSESKELGGTGVAMEERQTKKCKVIVVGAAAVGKTTIIDTYMKGKSGDKIQATLAASSQKKKFEDVKVHGVFLDVVLEIWDTPGANHFSLKDDFNNADYAILVYSIDLESTYENIEDIYEKISASNPQTKFVLVGNKSDLDKEGKR